MAITNPISELEDENGNVLGIAAKGLDTPVQISLTGNVTGDSGNTDLSGNVTIPTTITNGSVTESKIATDAVTNGKVKDGELTKAKLNASAYNEVDGSIADGTNANLATKTQVKAYVESVLSSEGHYKGVQSVATINTWTAANLHNGDRVITSSDPAGSGTGTLTLGNLPVVDGQEVIFYVSDDQSVKIWQSSEGNYKIKQAAKTDPTASGTTITAIDTISQNSNGEITATKKTIRSGTTSQTGIVQLKGSIAASESDDSKAATPKAVRDTINALDVAEVGGEGKYIKAVSEVDGKIAATSETMDTTPKANSQKAITSGGVKAAIAALDAASVGGNGKFISAISETDGIINATEKTMDSVPTENHTDTTVTSAGIKAALDVKQNRGMVDGLSNVTLPNNTGTEFMRNVAVTLKDYVRYILLYDVTEFYDGTITNDGVEHSAFTGVVTMQRVSTGHHNNAIANVSAGIGYASSISTLRTDNVSFSPRIVRKDVEKVGTWVYNKGYVIGDVGSTAMSPVDVANARCMELDVSNIPTLYVSAGFSSESSLGPLAHVWAFLDSNNRVLSNGGSAYQFNDAVPVPSGAVKFICNSNSVNDGYVGVQASMPRWYLAIANSFNSSSVCSLFGRFFTRTTSTASRSARPLLMESVGCIAPLATNTPAGWTEVKDAMLYVNASTADSAREGSALATAIASKVDKVDGKGLSTNDFTNDLKSKLDGIAAGAEVNVQSDWNQTNTNADDYIKHKPQNLVQDANYVHTDNNFTSTYKDKVDANTTARHTHSNKTVLDGITAEKVAAWDAKQDAISWMTDSETDALFTAAWNAANA